jgi:hypothetical protein
MTLSASRRLITVGQSLPRVSFDQVSGPGRLAWNQGTRASVIFVPHLGSCPDCARYAESLSGAVEGLREWGTQALVLVAPEAELTAPGCLLLADDGAGRAQLGVGDEQAAVVQADRWGAVYQVEAIGPGATGHGLFPAPEDLVRLAQFIDIQCPECAIPSREWMAVNPYPLG